jgi:protein translocase SecG subunit
MNAMISVILAVQMLSALVMIGLILMQQGKGADMGAAFGSGNSGSLFGATGGANFLSRTTAVLAAVFFVTTTLAISVLPPLAAYWRARLLSCQPLLITVRLHKFQEMPPRHLQVLSKNLGRLSYLTTTHKFRCLPLRFGRFEGKLRVVLRAKTHA